MRVSSGFGRYRGICFSPVLLLFAVGCGSDDGGSGTGPTNSALFGQSPHCASNSDALKIEGTIAGAAIDDMRTTNINAGVVNIGSGQFLTPAVDLAPLASNQLTLTIDWSGSLSYGDRAEIAGGKLKLPATHPSAGSAFCVSAGEVGFVDGGNEDGSFKFAITEVRTGADCSGPAQAVDLRGCFQ